MKGEEERKKICKETGRYRVRERGIERDKRVGEVKREKRERERGEREKKDRGGQREERERKREKGREEGSREREGGERERDSEIEGLKGGEIGRGWEGVGADQVSTNSFYNIIGMGAK